MQVPQGFAAEEPKKYVLDDEEYERISKLAQLQLEDARDAEPEEESVPAEGDKIVYS
jgi:periodic tryptophan protein 1